MKTIITFLCVLCIISCATDDPTQELVATIFDGDVELVTQQAVEDFGAMGYTEITGDLVISSQFENPDPVSSLSSLSTLEIIGGNLLLQNLYDITSLEGLQNLTSVTGELSLWGNANITTLDAFSSINSTVASLIVYSFREIETLDGLENISIASGGSLIIEGNDKLLNLDAIQDGIPSVMEAIKFEEYLPQCSAFLNCSDIPPEVQPFTSLAFLSNVTEVEWLRIKGFQGTSLVGTENITTINRLSLWYNPNIINLQELSGVTGDLLAVFISDNNQLETLDGLENITTITNALNVVGNVALTDLCALQNSVSSLSEDDVLILTNSFNPTLQDIIDGNCSE